MKNLLLIMVCAALGGCASPSHRISPLPRAGATESPADTAKTRYWQLQQPRADGDAAPRYRRLTITIPARTENGVNYEAQTRTILIAE